LLKKQYINNDNLSAWGVQFSPQPFIPLGEAKKKMSELHYERISSTISEWEEMFYENCDLEDYKKNESENPYRMNLNYVI